MNVKHPCLLRQLEKDMHAPKKSVVEASTLQPYLIAKARTSPNIHQQQNKNIGVHISWRALSLGHSWTKYGSVSGEGKNHRQHPKCWVIKKWAVPASTALRALWKESQKPRDLSAHTAREPWTVSHASEVRWDWDWCYPLGVYHGSHQPKFSPCRT